MFIPSLNSVHAIAFNFFFSIRTLLFPWYNTIRLWNNVSYRGITIVYTFNSKTWENKKFEKKTATIKFPVWQNEFSCHHKMYNVNWSTLVEFGSSRFIISYFQLETNLILFIRSLLLNQFQKLTPKGKWNLFGMESLGCCVLLTNKYSNIPKISTLEILHSTFNNNDTWWLSWKHGKW